LAGRSGGIDLWPVMWLNPGAVGHLGVAKAAWLMFEYLSADESDLGPAGHLAVDEALLEWCEDHPEAEVLRFWESSVPFVVLGRSGEAEAEVDLDRCGRLGVEVLRRCSGGGTVLQGPGCLNYALVLRQDRSEGTRSIGGTNRWIMEIHRSSWASLSGKSSGVEEITDLVCGGRKISGSAQRRGRTHLLFHGTFLLSFDLGRMDWLLRDPARAPVYRAGRSHGDFVANLGVSAEVVRRGLKGTWGADHPFPGGLAPYVERLMRERYLRTEWHRRY